MLIAVLSDIHDNIWKLEEALKGLLQAEELIFCGDFCAPFTLKQIADSFPGPVHVVFGNNDGDKLLLSRVATKAGNVTLHGEFAELELGGRRIAATHYPAIAVGLAASERYDLVCCGHSHRVAEERVRDTLLINPGEVMGRFGRSTYVLYDTDTGQATLREIG